MLSRREWLRLSALGALAPSLSGWLAPLAHAAAAHPLRKRSCILLWMNGGPSQMDTFDLKPGHANGGPFKETATTAPGLKICEHLPKVARFGHRMAVIRSMTTKEGDHGRASYLLRTGYMPQGAINHPSLGAFLAKELTRPDLALPSFVSIAPYRQFNQGAYGSGFLGPQHAPLIIADNNGANLGPRGLNYEQALKVQDLVPAHTTSREHEDARLEILGDLERDFLRDRPDPPPRSHQSAYARAVRMMRTSAARAFHLEDEPAAVRDAYGRNLFGQGCLLARRLVERGVPFVEVTLGNLNNNAFGWDTHNQNFTAVKALCDMLDPAWATLMKDLQERGLLDTTTIVWMGEFGRTPTINGSQGRDHWPNSWSTVIAGGGIKGGQAYGKTGPDGVAVTENPVTVPDFLSTVVKALGLDPDRPNTAPNGRPIRLVDKTGRPINAILA
jgi:hypothetical protein